MGASRLSSMPLSSCRALDLRAADNHRSAQAHATIEAQVLKWSATRCLSLAEKLLTSVESFATPDLATAWEAEIGRRTAEIHTGQAEAVSAEQVIAEARKRLDTARRVPSARRPRTRRVR